MPANSLPRHSTSPVTEIPRHLSLLAPGLDAFAPPLDLVTRPTPISDVPELAKKWQLASFHVKRDDLSHPAYGGCKVRTLEYILGHARHSGSTGIATLGPHGSHQAVTLAILGHMHGFQTRAVLAPRLRTPEVELNESVLPIYGMEVLHCGNFFTALAAIVRAHIRPLGGQRPYWLPPGAKHPLGVLGIVEGALELAYSIQAGELPMPHDVIVPTGSAVTAAGLLLGFAMARLPVRVVAVRIIPKIVTGPRRMRRLAEKTLTLLRKHGFNAPVSWGEMLWVDDQAGRVTAGTIHSPNKRWLTWMP